MTTQQQKEQHAIRPAETLLLEFLNGNDAACPSCNYNLRGLTVAVCPECRQSLVLTVGIKRLRLRWLLLALAPCYFAGIAACFAIFPTVGIYVEDGLVYPPMAFAVLFGWCSGAFAILLGIKRSRFLAQSKVRQRWMTLGIWLVHLAAFVVLVALIAPYWS